ncbi:MAG: hypothetical protein G01um101418_28 [Parcubacteria group bacterium Gr01-1014_18]|nr:MAG: hypothetical protein Greene041636_28 [Parcubacteria group bacterium Greene0416_36]TSC81534.1 MAG: hypothetical protein G01um101418_28 [Parcubacteria group bacterium Gr01-1014_18]TSC99655.1 MAG: hypothetical protein Greene101420_59 [Parcubacteria group bacterium Greene1014_20]TSD07106.1 MAG: hypothetical protein Greene07142_418 [Parcubacteria group bacterium Greene0714_2]
MSASNFFKRSDISEVDRLILFLVCLGEKKPQNFQYVLTVLGIQSKFFVDIDDRFLSLSGESVDLSEENSQSLLKIYKKDLEALKVQATEILQERACYNLLAQVEQEAMTFLKSASFKFLVDLKVPADKSKSYPYLRMEVTRYEKLLKFTLKEELNNWVVNLDLGALGWECSSGDKYRIWHKQIAEK